MAKPSQCLACWIFVCFSWTARGHREALNETAHGRHVEIMSEGTLNAGAQELRHVANKTGSGVAVLAGLVAGGCAWGALGGLAEFKSETAILSNEEIKVALEHMKDGVQSISKVLTFKKDKLSQLAAWDYKWWELSLFQRIEEAAPKHIFDLEALDVYNRKVKLAWMKFMRNFHEYHHISSLAPESGDFEEGLCSQGNNETCSDIRFLFLDAPFRDDTVMRAYSNPCEFDLGVCHTKKGLKMPPWKEMLETKNCSTNFCNCGEHQP
eukprot:TRINITY_DN112065_c0_g1_i1.p1 TRINITY_DN112065_c0_g1~~TRINITY_DN112065_c0_g1_i1.p1  ORF type:complete len:266 (-),score=35.44 TRINITY_DN112065_c0_g1_i1:21-818(-)